MMGRRKAFDPSRFFIFCGNILGSPYGSASPLTINPTTGKPYGPSFPKTTIRDDVRIHKLLLDQFQVTSIAAVIGGSMGGMHVLEWPLCTPAGYVRNIIPLSTSAAQSAWCIAWAETQRQCIQADPNFRGGRYSDDAKPTAGLAAARSCAMLTYRSRESFERRFGRRIQPVGTAGKKKRTRKDPTIMTPPPSPPNINLRLDAASPLAPPPQTIFSAQSYLRYQGQKFITRFDANCYIHITHKMDDHDISRDRGVPGTDANANANAIASVLTSLPPTLTISISSDGLFPVIEQALLAEHIPEAEHVILDSPEGHDGFLLEFERMNEVIEEFLRRRVPGVYLGKPLEEEQEEDIEGFEVKKTSVFGEAETADDFVEFGSEKPRDQHQSHQIR